MILPTPHIGTRLQIGQIDPIQPLDYTHPLLRGLQGFWLPLPHLTGGSRLYDISGRGRHGDLQADAQWDHDADVHFSVLDFDGTGDYVSTSYVPPTGSDPRTVAMWVRPDDASNDTDPAFVWWGSGANGADGTNFKFNTETDANGDYCILFRHQGGNIAYHAGAFRKAAWQYVVIVVPPEATNTSDVDVYLDGTLDTGTRNAGSDQALNTGTNVLQFGAWDTSKSFTNVYWAGRLTSPLVLDRGMSLAEARALYDQARRGFPDLLRRRRTLVATSGAADQPIALTGTSAGQAAADAQVTRQLLAEAAAGGDASAEAGLTALRQLTAQADSSAFAQATLQAARQMAATAQGEAGASGTLQTGGSLAGVATAESGASGKLTAATLLTAVAQASGQGAGGLSAEKLLTAQGAARAEAAGQLALRKLLTATAEAGGGRGGFAHRRRPDRQPAARPPRRSFPAPAPHRSLRAHESHRHLSVAAMSIFEKDPGATLDFGGDWADYLEDDESITSSSVEVPDGLSKVSDDLVGTEHIVFVSGGAAQEYYKVRFKVETDKGRIDYRTLTIACEEQ